MKIIFCGTPEYAVPSLRRLARLPGHDLVAVVSQPDRPQGRSRTPVSPPVVNAARDLGLSAERILQPRSINEKAILQKLKELSPDLLCVIAFGQLLKQGALALPRLFALNAHGSLLPKFRGAAPIQAALLAGERETGVTIMKIELGLDKGPCLLNRKLAIAPSDDAGSLHDKLAELSAESFAEALAAVEAGHCAFTPQEESAATYAAKLTKESGRMDWKLEATGLECFIRAMNPWPGAWTTVHAPGGKPRRVRLAACAVSSPPETLASVGAGCVAATGAEAGIIVRCGSGALLLRRLQPEGGREMSAAEFLRGAGKDFSSAEMRWE
jgi:methionyl-tRNA formyltransferase